MVGNFGCAGRFIGKDHMVIVGPRMAQRSNLSPLVRIGRGFNLLWDTVKNAMEKKLTGADRCQVWGKYGVTH